MFKRTAAAVMVALVFCAGGCALRQKPKPQPDLANIGSVAKIDLRQGRS